MGSALRNNIHLKLFQTTSHLSTKTSNKFQSHWNPNKVFKEVYKTISCIRMAGKVCNFRKIAIRIYPDQLRILANKIEMKTFRVHWFIKGSLSSYRMARWHRSFRGISKILYLGSRTWVQFKPLCRLLMR